MTTNARKGTCSVLLNNLETVHEQLKADKKVIVAQYMALTDSEAKTCRPVYEEYQNDLDKVNQRLGTLLQSYAADYRSKSLTDAKAQTRLAPRSSSSAVVISAGSLTLSSPGGQ